MSSFQGLYTDFYTPASYLVKDVNLLSKKTETGHRYIDLPYVKATNENLRGFGRLIDDFEGTPVQIEQWPSVNGRPIIDGRGAGETTPKPFECEWKDNFCYVNNQSWETNYLMGFRENGHIYATDANTHPDAQQLFWNEGGRPFVVILSKHQDEASIKPTHFAAFYFEGRSGVVINANVYHCAAFPISDDKITLETKQGKVHGDVVTDCTVEYGVLMRIPDAFTPPASTDLPGYFNPPPPPVQIVFSSDEDDTSSHSLPKDFISSTLVPILATHDNFKPYGCLIEKPSDDIDIEILKWPSKVRPVFLGDEAGTRTVEFIAEWMEDRLWIKTNDLVFSAGYNWDEKRKIYQIKLFFGRADGEALLSVNEKTAWLLVVAKQIDENRDPDPSTLQAFIVPAGQGVKLPAFLWHSTPIPLNQGKLTIRSKVNAANAFHKIDIEEECGGPLEVEKEKM